jgi:hypothetical protein
MIVAVSSVISIPARRNGPLESGQGGYAAGLLAGFLDGAAEVSLRAPVPLDRDLDVAHDDGLVRLLDGETLVAEGRAVPGFELDVPEPVSTQEARDATTRYRGLTDGQFSHCFVCGRAREDSYGVFAGTVEERHVVASPWTPSPETADEDGLVRPEFIWAVLDCPTYFALYAEEETLPVSFLARQTARIDAEVPAGEEHVIMAWPLGRDGRKHTAGIALLSAGGQPLAVAEALLIQAR